MSQLAPIAERAAAPARLAVPTAGDLAWRPLVKTDAPALLELQNVIFEADAVPYRHTLGEVEESFDAPWRDFAANSLVGVDAAGVFRAYASVDTQPGDAGTQRVFLGGGVHPSRRGEGIGREVLAWTTSRARQLLAESGTDRPARISGFVEDSVPAATHRLFEQAGFTARRFYSELRRDLTEQIPSPDLHGSLRIAPWTEDLDEPARLAHNDAFRDHWGSEPRTRESWAHGRSEFAPQWSFAVVDEAPDVAGLLAHPDTDAETADALRSGAPLVVGYHVAARYDKDWPVRGYRFGYTEILGVRRAYRGRKVARALLSTAMRAYAADGMQYACLDVDTENPTGAFGLYASLGYAKLSSSRMYAIEV